MVVHLITHTSFTPITTKKCYIWFTLHVPTWGRLQMNKKLTQYLVVSWTTAATILTQYHRWVSGVNSGTGYIHVRIQPNWLLIHKIKLTVFWATLFRYAIFFPSRNLPSYRFSYTTSLTHQNSADLWLPY